MATYETLTGVKVPQTLTITVPIPGAAVVGSGLFSDIPVWISDNSYSLTAAKVAIAVIGSTSACINIGHAYNASGGQNYASASRMVAANVLATASTIGSTLALNGSFQNFGVNDVLVAHVGGYWPDRLSLATLSFTLQRV